MSNLARRIESGLVAGAVVGAVFLSGCGGGASPRAVEKSSTPPAAATAKPTDSLPPPTGQPTSAPTAEPTATATVQATRVVEATATPGPVEQKSLIGAQLKDSGQTMTIGGASYPVSDVLNPGIGGRIELGTVEQQAASLAPFNTFMETNDGRMVSGVLDGAGRLVVMAEFRDGSWVLTSDKSVVDLVRPVAGSGLINLRTVNSDMTVGGVVATITEGQALVRLPNVKPSRAVIGGKTYEFVEVLGRDGGLAWVASEVVEPLENRVSAKQTATAVPPLPTTLAPTREVPKAATAEAKKETTLPIPVGATYQGRLMCGTTSCGGLLYARDGDRVVLVYYVDEKDATGGANRFANLTNVANFRSDGREFVQEGGSYMVSLKIEDGGAISGVFTNGKLKDGKARFVLSQTGSGADHFYSAALALVDPLTPDSVKKFSGLDRIKAMFPKYTGWSN